MSTAGDDFAWVTVILMARVGIMNWVPCGDAAVVSPVTDRQTQTRHMRRMRRDSVSYVYKL